MQVIIAWVLLFLTDITKMKTENSSPMFPLLRYFSLTSLVVMAIATASLWELYSRTSVENLLAAEESRNVALATVLANSLWDEAIPLVKQAEQNPQALREHPSMTSLQEAVKAQIESQTIIKVKMYTLSGITIFSTDPAQIGNDKSGASGFRRAREGEVVSELVHKDSIYSLEGVLSKRDLITSYVPVLDTKGHILGVLELYSDITEYLEREKTTQWVLAAGLFAVFITLYVLLFVVVFRADRIMKAQEAERLVHQNEIAHRANHDNLTNLPNRTMMKEHLSLILPRSQRNETLVAVMFLDLDGFKSVNDNLGHHIGDLLLQKVAERLNIEVRASDMVCRLGGDEFTVVLDDIKNIEEVVICAERIVRSLAEPYVLEGAEVSVTTSMGISAYPLDSEELDNILNHADAAMYAAKEEGKNQFRLYDISLDKRNAKKMQLHADLRHALEKDQFEIYYQPKINFQTGHIDGVEALLRWNHPEMGVLLPGVFLPLLKGSDLIRSVGNWVMEEACQQNKIWQDSGLRTIGMAINVSSRQFLDRTFSKRVQGAILRSGIAAKHLQLEVTEEVLLKDEKNALRILQGLKETGVRIAIDNFGTGCSSLTSLRNFPVDTIKIARPFVETMLTDRGNAAIVTAVLALAHGMKLRIVAEGVENEAQYAYLHALRCDEMQGFLFSRPLQAGEFEKMLRKDEPIKLKRETSVPVV